MQMIDQRIILSDEVWWSFCRWSWRSADTGQLTQVEDAAAAKDFTDLLLKLPLPCLCGVTVSIILYTYLNELHQMVFWSLLK